MSAEPKTSLKVQRTFSTAPAPRLQRKCACRGSCEDCSKPRRDLQRRATAESTPAPLAIVGDVLISPGQPLDASTRAFMEPRFGHDFGHVRVHNDARANESAAAVNALAYTVGEHVVFRSEHYAPSTRTGKNLLAHELTHVVQQQEGIHLRDGVGEVDDRWEQHADAVATRVADGGSAMPHAGELHARNVSKQAPLTPAGIQFQKNGEPEELPTGLDPTSNPAQGAMERAKMQAEQIGTPQPTVFLCSKALHRKPGTHAFFRVGGFRAGTPTYSLLPEEHGIGCWQGQPKKNFSADVNADAQCISTRITIPRLESEYASYPIGHYCTWGPNSNTFAGSLARGCGMTNPDPPGWNPGFDDSPPPAGTFAPSPETTFFGCSTKSCGGNANTQSEPHPVTTYGVTPEPEQ